MDKGAPRRTGAAAALGAPRTPARSPAHARSQPPGPNLCFPRQDPGKRGDPEQAVSRCYCCGATTLEAVTKTELTLRLAHRKTSPTAGGCVSRSHTGRPRGEALARLLASPVSALHGEEKKSPVKSIPNFNRASISQRGFSRSPRYSKCSK